MKELLKKLREEFPNEKMETKTKIIEYLPPISEFDALDFRRMNSIVFNRNIY